jgi:hypothetical protein
MRRIVIACALAGVLGVPAKADETLNFRAPRPTGQSFNAAGRRRLGSRNQA